MLYFCTIYSIEVNFTLMRLTLVELFCFNKMVVYCLLNIAFSGKDTGQFIVTKTKLLE